MRKYLKKILLFSALSCLFLTSASAYDITFFINDDSITIDELVTDEDLALMQSQEVYTAGYVKDFAPVSYINNDGEISGTAIDAINAISNALNITIEFEEISNIDENNTGIDICLIPFYPGSDLSAQSSVSYHQTSYVIIFDSNLKEGVRKPIGILDYFELSEDDIDRLLGNVPCNSYVDFNAMNRAFEDGEISSMMLTTARYNNIKNQIVDDNYTVDILDGYYYYTFTYPEEFDTQKIEIIDKLLVNFNHQSLNHSILNHSTADSTELTFTNLMLQNPIRILQLLLVVFLIILFFIMVTVAIYETINKRKLIYNLNTDGLTGLSSLHHFTQELERILSKNPLRNYTIFSLDIDNFKYVNEIYGHEVGTKLLKELGIYIKTSLPHAPIIARPTADQFLILMETKDISSDLFISERPQIIQNFINSKHSLGSDYNFSFSIGFYHIKDTSQDVGYIINCARLARDLGKSTAGYTLHEFTSEMEQERSKNNEIAAKMDNAIKNHEFVVYYQPKIDLKT